MHPELLGDDTTELYCGIVETVSSVPWGLGDWHSDEHAQWYFAAVWLAVSYGSAATEKACAASKVGKKFRSGGNGLSLWYYAYDSYCEQFDAKAVMCGLCDGKGDAEGYFFLQSDHPTQFGPESGPLSEGPGTRRYRPSIGSCGGGQQLSQHAEPMRAASLPTR